MAKNLWLKIHPLSSGFALMILALTQVSVGIQNAAEVACIGQTSNKRSRLEKNH